MIFFGVGDVVLVDFIGVDDLMDFVPIKVLHNDSINRVNDLVWLGYEETIEYHILSESVEK